MSLLTSLIRASTQFQQAMEKRPAPEAANGRASAQTAATTEAQGKGNDDRYTWSPDAMSDPAQSRAPRLEITEYKQSVGQDLAFVRETLRHKLAEYAQHPATPLSVSKGVDGIEVEGRVPDKVRDQIRQDLNNNKHFSEAFRRLSRNEPTLEFMDTAMKLNKAYGVSNPLLDTLVSENEQFNGLQDLVHRYDSLRRNTGAAVQPTSKAYAFSLNARA
ncbi:MAG TPA: hypothetical protein DHU56_01880 [Marinobacter sp.]|nr:hypothetical protein [Marinobacter sp.]